MGFTIEKVKTYQDSTVECNVNFDKPTTINDFIKDVLKYNHDDVWGIIRIYVATTIKRYLAGFVYYKGEEIKDIMLSGNDTINQIITSAKMYVDTGNRINYDVIYGID